MPCINSKDSSEIFYVGGALQPYDQVCGTYACVCVLPWLYL